MIISIHQPNYIPWIGYFHKIAHSDVFVVFDDIQFPRGKDFIFRNKIKISVKSLSITSPLKTDLINNFASFWVRFVCFFNLFIIDAVNKFYNSKKFFNNW